MGRYSGSVCRLCRREGVKLFLKGERCYSEKCAVERRNYAPGQHGQARRKSTEYGLHLREKQRLRRYYGVMERQFRRYFRVAAKRKGVTGDALLQQLELRLDNVVYRLGLAVSRPQARQLVSHGHFTVNGRRVDVPSYPLRPGDVVGVREGSRDLALIRENAAAAASRGLPTWLEFSADRLEGRVLAVPAREQIDAPVQEQLVVEHYSR
ncbi:MAG: 30S ribosomal protein S4 [Limnochordaceae bacterium]|uniref:Small ribosomal subunit protein uS4 n=1 Tax=Carboxydichorda subterranea TaxID=3109565 RepID=A0ABZ1BY53_9FIRM|nr:30S ribosomal protein S4 [Limnochorda sp. L945t]MBE3599008.1 30S ribosomal protein S4 [Limnochordaceae bacterium]WRP17741.1 30S ribosomal protein S4 [Limnochorda sp. L945t]